MRDRDRMSSFFSISLDIDFVITCSFNIDFVITCSFNIDFVVI